MGGYQLLQSVFGVEASFICIIFLYICLYLISVSMEIKNVWTGSGKELIIESAILRMNVLVLLAHPDISSLNHALAVAVQCTLKAAGHHVVFHDLYAEQFDPLLPAQEIPRNAVLDPVITAHCNDLSEADGIIVIHPNWWGQPPAILTGWIDRVVRPGIAYRFQENDNGEGIPLGLLRATKALIINTSNTPKERENSVFGDPLERIWKDCVFGLCGVKEVHRIVLRTVVTSTPEERSCWIHHVQETSLSLFPPIK